MAKETSSDGERPTPQKPRRKGVTIDLAAKEVGRKPDAEPGAPPVNPGDATEPDITDMGSTPEAPMPEPTVVPDPPVTPEPSAKPRVAAAGRKPSPPPYAADKPHVADRPDRRSEQPATPRPGEEDENASRTLLPLVAASLGGGAVVALVVLLLALAGLFSPTGDTENLSAEIAALRAEVTELRKPPATDALQPLRDEIAALKQSLAEVAARPAATRGDDAALKTIETRIAELERIAQSGGGASGNAALDARVTALADEVASVKQSGAVPADVEGAIGELEKSVSALSTRVDAAPAADRIAAIEARVDALGKTIDAAAALAPAVAAEALAAALESGRPFATELAALRSLGVDAASIAALDPQAESGLPTLAKLRDDFDAAIASVDLAEPVPENTGALGRLLQSARGLVSVRPAHPTEGADPAAVIARMNGALADGNLEAALAEWSSLPEPVKAATADWERQAEARLAADRLVATLRTDALSRLAPAE